MLKLHIYYRNGILLAMIAHKEALFKTLMPELTTSMLFAVLSDYKSPQKKIHDLTQLGTLISIKQGIYLLHPELASRPFSKLLLANLIYGPSYISLETALSHYGFIPERVDVTTSVCQGRNKSFETPVGRFEYLRVSPEIYPAGVQLHPVDEKVNSLFAGPEKALLDFIYLREKSGPFKNATEYFHYLVSSYRFDLTEIKNQISSKKLNECSKLYRPKRVRWFVDELIKEVLI